MQFVNLVSDSIRLEHVMWQVMWSFSLRHQEAIRLEFAKGANKQDAMALYESWFCLIVLIFLSIGSNLASSKSHTASLWTVPVCLASLNRFFFLIAQETMVGAVQPPDAAGAAASEAVEMENEAAADDAEGAESEHDEDADDQDVD